MIRGLIQHNRSAWVWIMAMLAEDIKDQGKMEHVTAGRKLGSYGMGLSPCRSNNPFYPYTFFF